MHNEGSQLPMSIPTEQNPLHSAFELFVAASNSLERQYSELSKKAELLSNDLIRANQRLSTLVNALPAAVILVEDLRVSHFNMAAEMLIPDLKHGQPLTFPVSWTAGDNADEYVIDANSNKKMVQVVSVSEDSRCVIQIHDITDSVRAREEKERTDRLAAMGHMSAGIAHQFRTPLATALLYSGHLTSATLAPEDKLHFAKKLHAQIERLIKLSGDMLTFVKARSQCFATIPLKDIIYACTTETDALQCKSNVALNITGDSSAFLINADRESLVSAFVAVLENAIEHSPTNATIRISVETEDNSCLVTIADQGAGIPVDVLPRLFEPFSSGRSNGTGLGLAMAKATVSAHGGDISASNRATGGAEFRIRLPGFVSLGLGIDG